MSNHTPEQACKAYQRGWLAATYNGDFAPPSTYPARRYWKRGWKAAKNHGSWNMYARRDEPMSPEKLRWLADMMCAPISKPFMQQGILERVIHVSPTEITFPY